MAKTTPTEPKMPTEAELIKAREVLAREAAARQADERKAMIPVMELTESEEFAKVRDALDKLPADILTNQHLGPHLTAIRTGIMGLAGVNRAALPIVEA